MKSKRVQALILAAAVAAGYAGAAAYSAWALPSVPVATDFGPGDGLTRYVLTAASGDATGLLAGLEATDGVVSAQRLSDGRALVATKGMAPQHVRALPGVADAEVSPSVPVLGTVTDPYFPQYGYNLDNTGTNSYNSPVVAGADVNAPQGWDGGTGNGRIVAVIDTGYDSGHAELAGALWTNPAEPCGSADADGNHKAGDCHGWNFTTDSADVDNGTYGSHGTSVSGVIGARAGNGLGTAGVAPDVTIMPLVIGSGSSVDVTLGAEAIRYAVDHGADVINASWGGVFSGWALDNLKSAVAYAAAHNVLVVAAAGNDSANRDTSVMYPASLTEANVVTVGNSTAADAISSSSAYGAAAVDLFAPGDLVFTTWNDGSFRLVSGTSIAAPQVAAAYALYRAAWPDATAAQLKQALLDDVEPVPAFAGKSVTGGRLSIGSLADGALGAVRYTFTSMTAPAGVVQPGVSATGDNLTGDYSVAVGLGMELGGEVWAVSGKELSLGGTTLTTDDSGEAVFALGAASSLADLALSPSMNLGDGRYVLTVQLYRDGTVLGRTYAAPLLVGTAVTAPSGSGAPGTGTPGIGTPGTGTPGSPGTGTPGTPGAGTPSTGSGASGSGGSGSSGTGDGSGTPPDATGDGSGTPDTGTPRSGTPGTPGTGTPGSGSSGSGSSGSDGSGAGGSGSGGAGSGGAPAPSPEVGGSVTFPGSGPFGITSMSPATVDVAGGTLVTITGSALPANPRVRVGDSASAVVVSSSATSLVFRAPARVAGVYDVHVFATDGTTDVLTAALTYLDGAGAGSPGTPETGTPDTGTPGPGTPGTPGTGTPGAPGTPETGGSGAGGSAPDGSGSGSGSGSGGSGGAAEPVVTSGPGGERLVRTTKFTALGSIWSMDCSSSCTGVAI
ncbi:MAG: peptidase and in kexin sedolisin [Blastococcus sp.]|nr:peptidase and in kexin sedolisin [Blastococcus sp.]